MSKDLELSFKMSEEEKERIKKILLGNGGVRHYLLKIADGTELDVVDYKDYQRLEEELDAHSKGLCEAVNDKNKLQQRIDNSIKYLTSNKWGKDYEISNCRNHLLSILRGNKND